MKRFLIIILMVMFAVLGGLAAMPQTGQPKPPELASSYLYPIPRTLPPFSLTDHHGQAFTNENLQGKWSLVFVGYTSCPDICPTTMAKLASAYRELKHSLSLQVIFISVDPARDSQEKLNDYINFFNNEFIALTASHAKILPLTRELGFVYTMVGEGADYQVDHSASMVLISPEGTRYATIKPKAATPNQLPKITNKDLIHDLQAITAYYTP